MCKLLELELNFSFQDHFIDSKLLLHNSKVLLAHTQKNVLYCKLINVFYVINQRIVAAYILVIYFCDQKLFTANQKTHPSHFRRACQNWKLTIIFMIQSDEHDLQYYQYCYILRCGEGKKYMDHHIKTFYGKLSLICIHRCQFHSPCYISEQV